MNNKQSEMYNELIENEVVTEEALDMILEINGNITQTLNDVAEYYGYDFDDNFEEENEDPYILFTANNKIDLEKALLISIEDGDNDYEYYTAEIDKNYTIPITIEDIIESGGILTVNPETCKEMLNGLSHTSEYDFSWNHIKEFHDNLLKILKKCIDQNTDMKVTIV